MARALMSRPRLPLLDELSLGLAPKIIADLFAVLDQLADEGMTLLVVDQMAGLALALGRSGLCDRRRQIVAQGPADALADDPALAQAYLGEQRAASPAEPVTADPMAIPEGCVVPGCWSRRQFGHRLPPPSGAGRAQVTIASRSDTRLSAALARLPGGVASARLTSPTQPPLLNSLPGRLPGIT
jgi:hypothetical protein